MQFELTILKPCGNPCNSNVVIFHVNYCNAALAIFEQFLPSSFVESASAADNCSPKGLSDCAKAKSHQSRHHNKSEGEKKTKQQSGLDHQIQKSKTQQSFLAAFLYFNEHTNLFGFVIDQKKREIHVEFSQYVLKLSANPIMVSPFPPWKGERERER